MSTAEYRKGYMRGRRSLAAELRVCAVCGDPLQDGDTTSCVECDEAHIMRMAELRKQRRSPPRLPASAVLLRMLCQFDVASPDELGARGNAGHQAMCRAAKRGHAERVAPGLYRITAAGRAWLAKQLARADVARAA